MFAILDSASRIRRMGQAKQLARKRRSPSAVGIEPVSPALPSEQDTRDEEQFRTVGKSIKAVVDTRRDQHDRKHCEQYHYIETICSRPPPWGKGDEKNIEQETITESDPCARVRY